MYAETVQTEAAVGSSCLLGSFAASLPHVLTTGALRELHEPD